MTAFIGNYFTLCYNKYYLHTTSTERTEKMKKFISLMAAMAVLCSSLFIASADTVTIPSGRPHFIGTFVQPWLYASWNDERANQEFTHMKEIGIQYIIMGDPISRSQIESTGKYKYSVTYPTTIDDAKKYYHGNDMVDMILKYGKKYGIKIYLGIGNDEDWSFYNPGHHDDYINFCNFSSEVAKDLYNQYKNKYPDTFYGFYYVPELWNNKGYDQDSTRNDCVSFISEGFNNIIDTLNKLDPKMPLLYSPFENINGNASLENTMKFYTEFYKKTNFRDIDILCPQDSIGAGGNDLEHLEAWTKGYKDAITNSGKHCKFWSNCEDFVQPKNTSDDWTSATAKRFIQQLQITGKYAENIVTFAYPHYWSPYNTISGFDRAYIKYLETGETDNVAPTAPSKIKYTVSDKKNVTLEWKPATDEYDIAQYIIYRYSPYTNKFIKLGQNVILRREGGASVPELNTSYDDEDTYNINNIYAIEAIDCAGNVSSKIVVKVDLKKTDNGVDLSSETGSTGIDITTNDLDKCAADITSEIKSSSSTPSSSPSSSSTGSGNPSSSSAPSNSSDNIDSASSNSSASNSDNPHTGDRPIAIASIFTIVTCGIALKLLSKKK